MASSSQIADLTCCAICLETFTRPKVLPCQHTYCYSCLLSLGDETNKTIACPQCRKVHKFPEGGIANFNDNIMANNLLGLCSPKDEELCADCGLQAAVSSCEHCNANLCVKCIVQHVKLALELKLSIDEVKDSILGPRTAEKRERLESAKNECLEQLEELKVFRKTRSQDLMRTLRDLLRNASSLKRFMEVVIRVYDDLLQSSEKTLPEDSYISSLSIETNKRTTTDSLKGLKNDVSDVKNILRLLQRMDGGFRFVPQADRLFGRIEFEQAVVDVQGSYRNDIMLEEIVELLSELGASEHNQTVEIALRSQLEVSRAAPKAKDVVAVEGTEVSETPSECAAIDLLEESAKPKVAGCSQFDETELEAVCRSPLSSLTPAVSTPTPVQENLQNKSPKNVDYHSKGKGWIPIIGRGKTVDRSKRLSQPLGVAYHAANDDIYVADYGNERIMVYNSDGSDGRVFYDILDPLDVAIGTDGAYIFIAAGYAGLVKVDLNGEHVESIESCSLGELYCVSLACHQHYTVLLDAHLGCVFVYDNNREIRHRHFGGRVLKKPQFVSVSEDSTIYVTDNEQRDIKVFRWNGQYLHTFLSSDEDYTYGPVAVDGDGYICVANLMYDHIEVYDPDYKRVATMSGPGKRPGRLDTPFAFSFMSDGRLIVADRHNGRLQIF